MGGAKQRALRPSLRPGQQRKEQCALWNNAGGEHVLWRIHGELRHPARQHATSWHAHRRRFTGLHFNMISHFLSKIRIESLMIILYSTFRETILGWRRFECPIVAMFTNAEVRWSTNAGSWRRRIASRPSRSSVSTLFAWATTTTLTG